MSEPAAVATPAEGAKEAKPASPWLPIIVMLIATPAISFAVTQFVLIPKIKSALAEDGTKKIAPAEGKKSEGAKAEGEKTDKKAEKKEGKGGTETENNYEFANVVVNLSGSMGTRYLKTSFTVNGSNPELNKILTDNKKKALDVAINILSAHTLADLETAGSKNMIRNDLIAGLNQAVGTDVVEQLYFSEFVIQ